MSSAIICVSPADATFCSAAIAGTERGAASSPAATVNAISQLKIVLAPISPFFARWEKKGKLPVHHNYERGYAFVA
jgi:hypothetical protein